PGPARIEASCPPFTCLPRTPEVAMPGTSDVRIAVATSLPREAIGDPRRSDIAGYRDEARAERRMARRILPHVEAAVAAVGVTALACTRAKLTRALCVREIATGEKAAGVIDAIAAYDVEQDARAVDARAEALYLQARAREKVATSVRIEV